MRKFYYDFAAAYGTLWLLMLLLAILTQSKIQLGTIGFFGFPAISLVWAVIMMSSRKTSNPNDITSDQKLREIRKKIEQDEVTSKLYRECGLPLTE